MFQTQKNWESRSTVRSRPHIVFNNSDSGYFYPVSRQILAIHPKVLKKGDDAIRYLLIQSLYKYANDISSIETRVVNQTILKTFALKSKLNLSNEQMLSLYTIMVDEAYHAYVAYDSMLQIENATGVRPLPLPKSIQIEHAIINIENKLPKEYHDVFELICVCIAENTLTKEIVSMTDQEDTHPFFQKIIKDHLYDETRHSGTFFHLLTHVWLNIDSEVKRNIAIVLVEFLDLYLGLGVQKEFEKQILLYLKFSDSDADSILSDIYDGFSLNSKHPMLSNIINILQKSKVLDEFTLPQFKLRGWLE